MLNLTKISRPLGANARPLLLKMNVVMLSRGKSAHDIGAEIAEGRWRWVFNFAVKPEGMLPDYRFWYREAAGQQVRRMDEETVIREIAGWDRELTTRQLCRMFSLSKATVCRLREQLGGRLERTGGVFERDGVERFLRERLCRPKLEGEAVLN